LVNSILIQKVLTLLSVAYRLILSASFTQNIYEKHFNINSEGMAYNYIRAERIIFVMKMLSNLDEKLLSNDIIT